MQYLFEKVGFNWMGVPNVWEGRVENRANGEKRPNSLGLEGEFSNLSLKHYNTPFTLLMANLLLL